MIFRQLHFIVDDGAVNYFYQNAGIQVGHFSPAQPILTQSIFKKGQGAGRFACQEIILNGLGYS